MAFSWTIATLLLVCAGSGVPSNGQYYNSAPAASGTTASSGVPAPASTSAAPVQVTPAPAPATAPPATAAPTQAPTAAPTSAPATAAPTQAPTQAPTPAPTPPATAAPTPSPTQAPTAAPTPAPTQAPTQAPTAAPSPAAALTCSSAGVTCIGIPTSCVAAGEATCDALAKVSTQGDVVHVELTASSAGQLNLNQNNRWVGVGFSKDGAMPDTPVVHCLNNAGASATRLTYNVAGGFNNNNGAGVDQSQLNVLSSAVDASKITCSADLKRQILIGGLIYDLTGVKHFLILGTGPASGGIIRMHTFLPVSSNPNSFFF